MAKFNIRDSFKNQKFRYGGYASLVTAVVLAIVVILNLVVGMDRFNKKFDLTQNKLFSLSDESKQSLKNISKKVTITGLYEQGKSGSDVDQIKEILNQYQAASGNIELKYEDPELHPAFAAKYKDDNGSTPSSGSIIVESGSKYKVIAYTDLYQYDNSNAQYDPTAQPTVVGIDAEQKVTMAIMYVTSDKNPTIYSLQGHKETALSQSYSQYFAQENYALKDVDLLKDTLTPESGNILLINAPQVDLNDQEYTKIKDYLTSGGRAMFLMDSSEKDIPNFKKLLNMYGVDINKSMIVEGDANYMYSNQYPNIILPNLGSSTITQQIVSAKMHVILANAMPIQQLKVKKDTTKIESILTTSAKAFGTNWDNPSPEKQANDLNGPFDVGVSITDQLDLSNPDKNTKLIVFSSSSVINDQLMQASNGANVSLFLNSMSWLAERKDMTTILPKSLTTENLTMTLSQSLTISAIAVVLIPGMVIVAGVCVWLRRRHL